MKSEAIKHGKPRLNQNSEVIKIDYSTPICTSFFNFDIKSGYVAIKSLTLTRFSQIFIFYTS